MGQAKVVQWALPQRPQLLRPHGWLLPLLLFVFAVAVAGERETAPQLRAQIQNAFLHPFDRWSGVWSLSSAPASH
jgi:hypothetical protein